MQQMALKQFSAAFQSLLLSVGKVNGDNWMVMHFSWVILSVDVEYYMLKPLLLLFRVPSSKNTEIWHWLAQERAK